jgi:hypothetical protein
MTVPLADRPTALYRFYDVSAEPLYFGIAVNPEERWKSHQYLLNGWWQKVDPKRTTVDWHPNRKAAMNAEAAAIKAEDPTFNRTHADRGQPSNEVRKNFSETLTHVQLLGEVVPISKHGQRAGVLVPPDWYDHAMDLMSAE